MCADLSLEFNKIDSHDEYFVFVACISFVFFLRIKSMRSVLCLYILDFKLTTSEKQYCVCVRSRVVLGK